MKIKALQIKKSNNGFLPYSCQIIIHSLQTIQRYVRGATQKFPKFECRAKTACSTVVGL
jgi:hypothetical protein